MIVRITDDRGRNLTSNSLPDKFTENLKTDFNTCSFNQAHILCDNILSPITIPIKKSDLSDLNLLTNDEIPICLQYNRCGNLNNRLKELYNNVRNNKINPPVENESGSLDSANLPNSTFSDKTQQIHKIRIETGNDNDIRKMKEYFANKVKIYDKEYKTGTKTLKGEKKIVEQTVKYLSEKKINLLAKETSRWPIFGRGWTYKNKKTGHYDKYLISRGKLLAQVNNISTSEIKTEHTSTTPQRQSSSNKIDKGVVILYVHLDIETTSTQNLSSYKDANSNKTLKISNGKLMYDENELGHIPGYAAINSGSAHIFNIAINKMKIVLHELGHGFGLRHPFDASVLGKYNPKPDRVELTDKQNKLKSIVSAYYGFDQDSSNAAHDLSYSENGKYYLIDSYLRQIDTLKEFEDNGFTFEDKDIESVAKYRLIEEGGSVTEQKSYNRYTVQGGTKENIMDYDQKNNGKSEENFAYKIFHHWQWEIMKKYTNFK